MLAQFFKKLPAIARTQYSFASAAVRDKINYYKILEVEEGATQQAIRAAYAELTAGLVPEHDYERFRQLNEAFVILTNNKTRDAYDSLLSVRKTNYLSEEQANVPSKKSYLAERKTQKLEQLKKKLNIDEFGRYQGGLPNKRGQSRRGALFPPGEMHRSYEIEEALDNYPEFNNVTAQKAESFKNFHQDQREARKMKWPWFTFQVDYNYFGMTKFRKNYWPKLQLFVLIFYIIPSFYYIFERLQKQQLTEVLRQKALKAQQAHQEQHSS